MNHMTTDRMYICIEGNIGAGKTTLATAIAERLRTSGKTVVLQQEPAEGKNPYLDLYYKDPARYAFHMQTFLLSKRRRMQLAAQAYCLAGEADVVSDRNYFGDRCFAEVQYDLGYFSDADYSTYLSLHKDMQAELLYPSAFIWLCSPIELCMKRIARRMSAIAGRECEAGIGQDYLMRLDRAICRMMNEMRRYTDVITLHPYTNDCQETSVDQLAAHAIDQLEHLSLNKRYDAWQGVC